MQLCLLSCLVLLSLQAAGLPRRHHHAWRTKKRARELPVASAEAPGNQNFTFDLYRALAADSPDQNIFFSPLSIFQSLALIYLAAASDTKTQISEGLGLPAQGGPEEEEAFHRGSHQLLQELRQPRADLQLGLGTALFILPTVHIQDAFLSAARTLYLADTFPTNFRDPEAAQKQINDYVAKQTNGKIVDLVKDLDSSEIMVMVNYIFFKAKWETSFDPKSTLKQDFHVTSETVVQVPMMRREDEYHYLLDRNLYCRVVGVPYQGNATALFILPSQGRMEQVEAGLSQETLRRWLKKLTKRKLQLYLPKFSLEGSYQLEKVLPKLGIRDLFTSQADLTGFTNHSNIQVSEMVHRAVVEVDESGTKAAAAMATVFTFRSARIGAQVVAFNRPFLMMIVENNKNVLFLGRVMRP